MNSFSALAASVIPTPTPVVPEQAKGLLTVLNWASGIGLVLGVLGVIIVGIGMVIQLRRGEGGESIGKLGWVTGRLHHHHRRLRHRPRLRLNPQLPERFIMSESTQSSTERSPFTKPGFIISAALVVALIAAVVVIFILPKADNTAQPAPASSSARRLRVTDEVSRRGWQECLRAALKHGDSLGCSAEVQVGTRWEDGCPYRSQNLRAGSD